MFQQFHYYKQINNYLIREACLSLVKLIILDKPIGSFTPRAPNSYSYQNIMPNYSITPKPRQHEIMTERIAPQSNIFQQNMLNNSGQMGMFHNGFLPPINKNPVFIQKPLKPLAGIEQKLTKQNELLEKLMNKMNNDNIETNNQYNPQIEQDLEKLKYKVMMNELEKKMVETNNQPEKEKKKKKKPRKKLDIQSLVLDMITNDLNKKNGKSSRSSSRESSASSKSSPLLEENKIKRTKDRIIILPDNVNHNPYNYPIYQAQNEFSPRASYEPNFSSTTTPRSHYISRTYQDLDSNRSHPSSLMPGRGYSVHPINEPSTYNLDPRMIQSQNYQPIYSQHINDNIPIKRNTDPYGYNERQSFHSNPDFQRDDLYSTPRKMNSHNVSISRSPGSLTDNSLNHSKNSIENDYIKNKNMKDEIIEVSDEELASPLIVRTKGMKNSKKLTIRRNIAGKSLKSLRSLNRIEDKEAVFDFDESIMEDKPTIKRAKAKRKVSWKSPSSNLTLKSLCWAIIYPKLLMKDAKKIVVRKRHQTLKEVPKKLDAAFEVNILDNILIND